MGVKAVQAEEVEAQEICLDQHVLQEAQAAVELVKEHMLVAQTQLLEQQILAQAEAEVLMLLLRVAEILVEESRVGLE